MKLDKSDFSEWYNSIIKEAQLCDLRYGIKGFVVFMPWAVMSMNRMYAMYEEAVEATGHVPALFPALIPEEYFKREGEHVKGFVPEVFWVTEAGNNKLEEKYAKEQGVAVVKREKYTTKDKCKPYGGAGANGKAGAQGASAGK